MVTYKFIATVGLILLLSACASKTGMEYIPMENGHTKVIDYDQGNTSYIDHNGRVYKRVYWKDGTEDGT